MIIHIIMKIMKNRWLLVNGQINSDCESCLRYSNKNLTKLYRSKNVVHILQIFRLLFFICFVKIIIDVMNNNIHSKIIERKFVLILRAESILS